MREQIAAISVDAASSIRDGMRAIDRGALGVALLIDAHGVLAGLVTDGDIRRALLGGAGLETPLAKFANPTPVVASAGAPAEEVNRLFDERVHIVPLLDEHGRVADLALFDRRVRLPVASPLLGERELQYATECVLSGWVSSAGPFVGRFEETFAAFCGARHAISASNGTTALHLALLGLGIGAGDEVIVPSLTFISTANAVTYTGARPVPVDSDPDTWCIDPEAAAAAIGPATRAIMPVHLYGHPADMSAIADLAARHGLAVVEDAAEAHGARYRGQAVGSIGDVGVFSFYGNKIVTTGEGGMLVTDDDELAARIRMLRDHGTDPARRYWHPVVGYNYRLTNLQAAIGVAQMERVDEIIAAKQRAARLYDEGLGAVPGITLPPRAPWAENVFWLYSILVDSEAFGRPRDELIAALDRIGIETRPLFPPVHTQPPYAQGVELPVAERLAATGLSLPSAASLSEGEIARVVEAVAALAAPQAAAAP